MDLTPNAELEQEIGRAEEYFEKIQRALFMIRKASKDAPTRDRTGLRIRTEERTPLVKLRVVMN